MSGGATRSRTAHAGQAELKGLQRGRSCPRARATEPKTFLRTGDPEAAKPRAGLRKRPIPRRAVPNTCGAAFWAAAAEAGPFDTASKPFCRQDCVDRSWDSPRGDPLLCCQGVKRKPSPNRNICGSDAFSAETANRRPRLQRRYPASWPGPAERWLEGVARSGWAARRPCAGFRSVQTAGPTDGPDQDRPLRRSEARVRAALIAMPAVSACRGGKRAGQGVIGSSCASRVGRMRPMAAGRCGAQSHAACVTGQDQASMAEVLIGGCASPAGALPGRARWSAMWRTAIRAGARAGARGVGKALGPAAPRRRRRRRNCP